MTSTTLRIPTRFSGPIGFANGGWFAGAAAQACGDDPAQVTLRRPIPLETELTVDAGTLMIEDVLIAEVSTGSFTRDIPAFVDREAAIDAESRSLVRSSPQYGNCLVCGVDRTDGYHLRPGPVAGLDGTVACLWRPAQMTPPLPAEDRLAAAWAAMDCPGVWTIDAPLDPMLLGRMTATVTELPDLALEYIVVGRHDARDGRKMMTSTALYALDGTLLGHAEQIWIAVSEHP